MITTVRTRRLPIRACEVSRALADAGTSAALAQVLRGTHAFEVRQDRLACQVRHSVSVNRDLTSRLWWFAVGRPLYNELIEDTFDALAKATGAPVRRPVRWAPYSRLLRHLDSGASRGGLGARRRLAPIPRSARRMRRGSVDEHAGV